MCSARNDPDPGARRPRPASTAKAKEPGPLWRSFGLRINGLYLALFLGSLAVLFFLADLALQRALERRDVRALETELARQTSDLRARGVEGLRASTSTERTLLVRVSGRHNETLFRAGPEDAPADEALALPAGGEDPVFTRVEHRRTTWTFASAAPRPDRIVQVGISHALREATLSELRTGYLWVLGTAALLGLLGGAWLTRRTLRPLRSLAATARRVVDEGDLSARVPRRARADELDRIAALFNEMLGTNERLVKGMRHALDNVAHDLRTPLTRLRGSAEVALRSDDPAAQREALADTIEESDRVLKMLETLMDISEAEAGVMRLSREPVALDAVARDVADLYEHVAEESQIELRVQVDEPATADGDPTRLRQALSNLVDNAIKYTRAGGHVTIEVDREGGEAIARVRDDGVGIDGRDLDRIFQRLYRADPSRAERGLGLGLSLVRAIALAHGGDVTVDSEVGRGSVFELRLPSA